MNVSAILFYSVNNQFYGNKWVKTSTSLKFYLIQKSKNIFYTNVYLHAVIIFIHKAKKKNIVGLWSDQSYRIDVAMRFFSFFFLFVWFLFYFIFV